MTGPVRSGRANGTRAGVDWSVQPLGKVTDNALARELGVSFGTVQKARALRGIPRYQRSRLVIAGLAHLAGTMPDRDLARLVGCVDTTITAYRTRHGIPSASPARRDWDGIPLGLYYDTEIAEAFGCTLSSVADARSRRGIPPHREARTCGCGAAYLAHERGQRGCSVLCSQAAANHDIAGKPPEHVAVSQALAALRRDIRRQMKGHPPCGPVART